MLKSIHESGPEPTSLPAPNSGAFLSPSDPVVESDLEPFESPGAVMQSIAPVVESDLEPFESPGAVMQSIAPVVPWTVEQQTIIDRATERWGASNGDMIVGDLLRDYPAGLVRDACNSHYDKVNVSIHAGRLRGLCRSMFNGDWTPAEAGKWSKNGKPSRYDGPTNMPLDVQKIKREYAEEQSRKQKETNK